MAGGEGTRLRPLTSSQPKPMVSLCGKPCLEYILDLLVRHDVHDVVATLMFLPQIIRDAFGDGSTAGVNLEYSVELTPAGTAGSVKLAQERLGDDTFLAISGDALTDMDLTELLAFHRRSGALATIALKRMPNPLDFGVVITAADGRIERFLEKPTWGEVFSDTVNTGIYVLEPEILRRIPPARPFDFSSELFPLLLSAGAPLYGFVSDDYWQDIGSLDSYLAANRDLLDGRVKAAIPGLELHDRIFLGDGVNLEALEGMRGPAFVGNYARLDATARIDSYSVLGANVVVKANAWTRNSVVGANTYIGPSVALNGTIVGRHCDLKAGARCDEGAAIGDHCVLGEQAEIARDVKIYPFRTVEPGAQVTGSLIWEKRGRSRLFSREGVTGLVNVDVSAELAVRLAMAYGTVLPKGAVIAASRDAHRAARVMKRALISGLNGVGVNVSDLRVASSALTRFEIGRSGLDGGLHVYLAAWDPERVLIQFVEPPGIDLGEQAQKQIERTLGRQDFRRVAADDLGDVVYPHRTLNAYTDSLVAAWNAKAIRERAFRIVVDYAHSPASLVLPRILDALGVEFLVLRPTSHEPPTPAIRDWRDGDRDAVRTMILETRADLGLIVDADAERLSIIDETGEEVSHEAALLLFVKMVAQRSPAGSTIALPLTVTRLADALADQANARVLRTRSTPSALMHAAIADGVVLAGILGGGYIFPSFSPAFDAVASLAVLLDLLATTEEPMSRLIADLPRSSIIHRTIPCPWSRKGTVMRATTGELQTLAQKLHADITLIDGVRLTIGSAWAHLVPDSDEPVLHVFAEGVDITESERMSDIIVSAVGNALDGEAGEGEEWQVAECESASD